MEKTNRRLVIQPRVFLTFLSPTPFYSNPVRSFLQYLQNQPSPSFQFINFPKNLYTATEKLTGDYQPLTLSLLLPDASLHPVVIAITPTQNKSATLSLDFGNSDTAKYLLNEDASLIEILTTGARMTRAECAFVSLEAQPNINCKIKVELGRLYLEKLPLILWTTAPISEEFSAITADAKKIEKQGDGTLLIVSNALAIEKVTLWIDSSQTHYFLIPNNENIPSGNFLISNLDREEKQVDAVAITSWEITAQEAQYHLNDEIQQAIDNAKNSVSHLINFSLQKSPEPNQQTTNISEIVALLLGLTPEELQNHPELVQVGLENLLTTFKEVITNSLCADPNKLNIARQQMGLLQTTLREHGVNLGDNLAQFADQLHALQFLKSPTSSLQSYISKLRQFADKIDQFTANKEQDFGAAMMLLVNSYQELFGKQNEAQEKEKLQQEYRQLADNAIAQSVSDFQMPSFDFQDLLSGTNQ
jgi:hypothetical protein